MFDPDSDSAFTQQQREARNYVKFYPKWVRNNRASEEAGAEVGANVDYIMIICPGQTKSEVHRKASETDKLQYAQEWAAYQVGREQQQSGTPIEMLPGLPSGMADALKALYIYTIEQMANLSDLAMQKVGMGGNEIRLKARAYLERGSAELASVRAELADAMLTITTLNTTNKALRARLDELEAAAAQKPKRQARSAPKGEAVMLS